MVTFAVDPVVPAAEPLPTRTLGALSEGALCAGGDPARAIVDVRQIDRELEDVHPLIAAVALAFSQHRPLTLTPDAVWLTIARGVAQHVRDHADTLRGQLVRHAGQHELELEVTRPPRTAEDWQFVVGKLRELLAARIGDGRARLFECAFSTSSVDDLIASRIVLFDAYSPYFSYSVACVCGIPEITVTGTPADWRAIAARIPVIAELGLQHWCSRLAPIIDEFIAAAEGRPNIALWQRIYNPRDAYGGTLISGWITRLYPTTLQHGRWVENRMLAYAMHEPTSIDPVLPPGFPELEEGHVMLDAFRPALAISVFPQALSRVTVKLETGDIALVGGLVGVAQDARGVLTPIAGWHLERADVTRSES